VAFGNLRPILGLMAYMLLTPGNEGLQFVVVYVGLKRQNIGAGYTEIRLRQIILTLTKMAAVRIDSIR